MVLYYYEVMQYSNGHSLQIGSKQSELLIRIYDKIAEAYVNDTSCNARVTRFYSVATRKHRIHTYCKLC